MVLLNLDAGEHAEETPALWRTADILCVACGGHAGDDASMTRLVQHVASTPGTHLGAHPSYVDREGFGRRSGVLDPAALTAQCTALATIARAHGIAVEYVKLHGALYHDASRDAAIAEHALGACNAALGAVTVIGPQHGAMIAVARRLGMPYMREGFADRRTRPDGSLVPRTEPNALITDPAECAARARSLAAGVETICVHGDTPNAISIATAVRQAIHG